MPTKKTDWKERFKPVLTPNMKARIVKLATVDHRGGSQIARTMQLPVSTVVSYLTRYAQKKAATQSKPQGRTDLITDREKTEIKRLAKSGKTIREIAEILPRPVNTLYSFFGRHPEIPLTKRTSPTVSVNGRGPTTPRPKRQPPTKETYETSERISKVVERTAGFLEGLIYREARALGIAESELAERLATALSHHRERNP